MDAGKFFVSPDSPLMTEKNAEKLSRDAWLRAALEIVCSSGIEAVKIAPLAASLGVTTGSFYWHFKNRRDLLKAVLEFWEKEMTTTAIAAASSFSGTPEDRILRLMETVMADGMARYDLAISHWAQSDAEASKVFQHALEKRFEFAAWMFSEAGFDPVQAEARGRLMVVYMMGESSLVSGSVSQRLEMLRQKHAILVAPFKEIEEVAGG